jgi:Ubiquitin family
MQIFVKNLTGKTTVHEVQPSDTIDDVKKQIAARAGWVPETSVLHIGGITKTDHHALAFPQNTRTSSLADSLRVVAPSLNMALKRSQPFMLPHIWMVVPKEVVTQVPQAVPQEVAQDPVVVPQE